MNKREQYKKLLMFVASTVLLVLLTAIYAGVWYGYYSTKEVLGTVFWNRGNYVVIGLYALMVLIFGKVFGGFRAGSSRILESLYTQILVILCSNAVNYLQLCLIGNWRFLSNLRPIAVMTMVDIAVIVVWVLLTRLGYVKLYPPRKLLVVYGQYSPDSLIRKLTSRADKYDIQEAISVECGWEEIMEKICRYNNVLLMDVPAEVRNNVLKFCFEKDIRCYCVPKISDIMIQSASEIHLFDTSLLLFRNFGLSIEQRLIKRVWDVIISLAAIIISAPVMLIIAICIKAYDGGPVLFTQDRLTKGGKVFKLYKFRSMRVREQEREYCLTRKDDDRVTPVGKILRNIHFDELPQIFNILKGDMSFVGPRPECPELAEEYSKIVPEFKYRLKVKAGLTGFAQVYGKYNTTPYDKLKLDLTYIEKYSFLLDLKLMILTFKILFQKENTEGIESWQTNASTRNCKETADMK